MEDHLMRVEKESQIWTLFQPLEKFGALNVEIDESEK